MKFTDGFFKVLIKVYDGWDYSKAMITEDKELENNPETATPITGIKYVPCYYKIRPSDIIGWCELFDRETILSDEIIETFNRKGLPMTLIETKSFGNLPCMWDISKFEEKLNEFCNEINYNSNNSPKQE